MTSRIRIPGLVDLMTVDDAPTISALSEDPRLDRAFLAEGPLVNRALVGRLRRTLQVKGHPLPAVAARGEPGRAAAQAELERRLAATGFDPTQLAKLAAYVRGEAPKNAVGPAAQAAVGRLFSDSYPASRRTWDAARVFDAAPRPMNPLRRLWLTVTGGVSRARKRLAAPVGGDTAAVHATGIAVHNLVRGLKAMRELWGQKALRDGLSPEGAAARCSFAPENVLRQWTAPASTIAGEARRGTLTRFRLEDARRNCIGPRMMFMTDSWSRCPAHRWTLDLLAEVWRQAQAGRRP